MAIDLESIYDHHAQALFQFILNLTRDESDAGDLLQEVFVKLARQPDVLAEIRDCRAFLIRLAHNAAVDLVRRHSVRARADQALGEAGVGLFEQGRDPDEQSFREQLADALGDLPAEQRAVVHLKLWEEMTFEEIARALDIPINTAASRYRYGIDKLRALLRPLYDEIK